MKSLTIDIGNSRIKIGEFEDSHLQCVSTVSSLNELFDVVAQKSADQMIFSSVRKNEEQLTERFPNAIVLNSSTPLPFVNAYASPETLGNDRKALMAAAFVSYPKSNVLVIDSGTCVTFDVLNADGTYLGGSISPGWKMRLDAMNHFTAKLPLVEPVQTDLLGNSTVTCMQSGAYQGLLLEIQGTIDAYNERYSSLVTIITGGDSEVFASELKNNIFAHPDFLLVGLNEILLHAIARS